ncbi:hypothetical protein M422DRAFT_158665, partial [Sphaerobolus stellatus SS14]
HRTLGLIHMGAVKFLAKPGLVIGMNVNKSKPPTQCTACIQGKQHVEPFPPTASDQDLIPGEVIVSNVWGPSNTTGINPA